MRRLTAAVPSLPIVLTAGFCLLPAPAARASLITDFQSYATDADVQAHFVPQPGNGNNNVASSAITLGDDGAGNRFGRITSTVGATATSQFRSNFDPVDPDGGIHALPGIGTGTINVSATFLSRNTTRADGTQADVASFPFMQLGLTPDNPSTGVNKNTYAIYAEIANDGTSFDIAITGSATKDEIIPTGTRNKITIPGGFQNGGSLALSLAFPPATPPGSPAAGVTYADVTATYTDLSGNATVDGPFTVGFSDTAWAGTDVVPFIAQVRGYSADGSGGVAHGDIVTMDFDNFAATGPLVPEPASLSLLTLPALALRRRTRRR